MFFSQCSFQSVEDVFWRNVNMLRDELRSDSGPISLPPKFIETDKIREMAKNAITLFSHRLFESVSRDDNSLKIEIIDRRCWENVGFDDINGVHLLTLPTKYCAIKLKKQAQMLTLLLKIHNLLSKNAFISKRALFYEEKEMFRTQSSVDELIDDICCITLMKRYQLHIYPSSKGVIAGNVFISIDGETYNSATFKHGFPIPTRVCEIDSISSNARFILLVEKESIFSRLLSAKICDRMPLIMICGRGFPDVNTREMVKLLWQFLQIPILALVDADPYGIEIMCTYKYGSLSMAFSSDTCVTRQIKWLGIHPTDICRLNVPLESRLPLSHMDRAKMFDLSQRPYMQQNPEWASQLVVLSRLQEKVELECFSSLRQHGDYLADIVIPQKIKHGGWI